MVTQKIPPHKHFKFVDLGELKMIKLIVQISL